MDTAQKETLDTLIASLPITYNAVFVPQSQSRNAGEKLYQDCLAIALNLKALLDNETIEALRLAFQDY